MREPDCPSLLLKYGGGSGFRLENQSWLLSRLVRSSKHCHPDLDDGVVGLDRRASSLALQVYVFVADAEKYGSSSTKEMAATHLDANGHRTGQETKVKMGNDLV